MSKSAMLRTRRRDVNVKPNRRLDRKSSRGMIYENEELRLRTININAEIERGQSDIKKLRKENEQLRKEIWCLRDEYDKLDRLLKEKQDCTSSSDSESCTSCSESEDPETTQNIENVQKTTLNSLRNDFDHLSVVTEETSAENSDKNSQNSGVLGAKDPNWEVLPPDMGYPQFEGPKNMKLFNTTQNLHLNGGRLLLPHLPQLGAAHGSPLLGGQTRTLPLPSGVNSSSPQCPRHFFSPLKASKSEDAIGPPSGVAISGYKPWSPLLNPPPPVLTSFTCAPTTIPTITAPQTHLPTLLQPPIGSYSNLVPIQKSAPDILVQSNPDETSSNSFVNGGNLDELLQDIDNISQDILKISANSPNEGNAEGGPFKSEISVVLMPQPMPLLGFEKYGAGVSSLESVVDVGAPFGGPNWGEPEIPNIEERQDVKGSFTPLPEFPVVPGLQTPEVGEVGGVRGVGGNDKTDHNPFFFGSFNDNKTSSNTTKQNEDGGTPTVGAEPPTPKRTRKLSLYFKGNKKIERSLSLDTNNPQKEEKQDVPPKTDPKDSDNQKSSDSKTSYDKKHRKSSSTSPERRHVHIQDTHKKSHKKRQRKLNRRTSLSLDKFHRDRRSISVCTDRSNILEHRQGLEDFLTNSERDRSNSLSSCDTIKSRKTSQIPQLPVSGKIPWFGCWGNGCL